MNIDRIRKLAHANVMVRALLYPAIVARRSLLKNEASRAKKIVRNLGDILVGDPVIRVDEFSGEFAVDPRSDLFRRIVTNQHYEPQLAKLCVRYFDARRDVIDVGANIGFYSVMFAKLMSQKKVLSIEPTKNAIRRLRRNIDLNGVADKVEVFEGVASDRNGSIEIKTIQGKEEYSSLGEMKHPSIANDKWILEEVQSKRLDDLVEEHSLDPGFLKIDVEGVEHLVFKGAHKILSNNRPIILSELSELLLKNNNSSSIEVIDLLRSYEYDVFDAVNPSTQLEAKDFGDILCFPKEMKVQPEA